MILFAAAILALTTQNISVSVDVQPSEVLSGIRHFKVSVQSVDPVTQVEFYVGSELRDSDASIPYEFNLDTIDEKDGPLDLTFAAYTSKGDSQKDVVHVNIDNGLSQGVAPHVDKGLDALHDSKWDDAIVQGRIALKIAPENNKAREVMARAYLGKGSLDKAQKYAEDWHNSDPKDTDASELLSNIEVHRAFFTLSRGDNKEETLSNIQTAFKNAIGMRQVVLQEKLDKMTPPNADNLIEFADTALEARRYQLAINALSDEYRKHVERNDVTNRLAFAQLESGRVDDAYATLLQVKRLAKLDAYGNALMAVILSISHDEKGSKAFMDSAMAIDATDVGVRTAQAFIALRSKNATELSKVANAMLNDEGARPEVNYYMDALAALQGNYGDGRQYFETMIYADPLSEAGYMEEGNNALLFAIKGAADDQAFRAESAQAMFQTALEVRPESYRALEGLALARLLTGDKPVALKFSTAATQAAPSQASAWYVHAACLSANRMERDAYDADRKAWKLDHTLLDGMPVPKPIEAWAYYDQFDRFPVMTPPK